MIKSKILPLKRDPAKCGKNPKSKINPNTKYQNLQSCRLSFVIWISFVILMSGCAAVIEGVKGIAGVSTKVLEDNRKSAITKTLNYDYFSCYTKALDILKRIDAYIYVQDIRKNIIAIYVSEQDTTPVGLFFKEIDANHTQIEVSSPSTNGKEIIAARLFSALEKEGSNDSDKGKAQK